MGGANQSISAGVGGFLALFVLAIVLWLLMRNMSGRLRRIRFEEELEDERRAREAGDDLVSRPRRRQIFLPVRDEETASAAAADQQPVSDGGGTSDTPPRGTTS